MNKPWNMLWDVMVPVHWCREVGDGVFSEGPTSYLLPEKIDGFFVVTSSKLMCCMLLKIWF